MWSGKHWSSLDVGMSSKSIYMYVEYIYIIGHSSPSVRIIDLASHITYVVCVNFLRKWRDQFKVDLERHILRNFMAILFTLGGFARNLLRGNRRRNTFHISFRCLTWISNPGFTSNKPTHYLLDYGDINIKKPEALEVLSMKLNVMFAGTDNFSVP